MGCIYSVSVSGKVPKSNIAKLNKVFEDNEDLWTNTEDAEFDVQPNGDFLYNMSGHMSYSSVGSVDDALKEQVGPLLAEPARVEYEYEGENGDFFIGPSDAANALADAAQRFTDALKSIGTQEVEAAAAKLRELEGPQGRISGKKALDFCRSLLEELQVGSAKAATQAAKP